LPTRNLEAIVLRVGELGEADRLVTLCGREGGKVRAVARGARRPRSRLAGALQPLSHVRCLLAHTRSLDIITQVELVDSFPSVRQDLTRLTYAEHFLELVDTVAREEETESGLFALLLSGLHLLASGFDPELASRAFELRLLAVAGFELALRNCASCGSVPASPEPRFSPAHGGVLCPSCSTGGAVAVSPGVLGAMLYLKEATPRHLGRLVICERDRREMEGLLRACLVYHLDRPLRALKFLDTLRRART